MNIKITLLFLPFSHCRLQLFIVFYTTKCSIVYCHFSFKYLHVRGNQDEAGVRPHPTCSFHTNLQ